MSPFQFEIRNDDGSRSFIRVLNSFSHYYTGEHMRSIRIDSLAPNSIKSVSECMIVSEEDFEQLLERRIIDDQT